MSDDVIKKQLERFPDFLTPDDIVELGLFRDKDGAAQARVKGRSPDYVKFGRKVLYPKASLIQFLESRMKKGNSNV